MPLASIQRSSSAFQAHFLNVKAHMHKLNAPSYAESCSRWGTKSVALYAACHGEVINFTSNCSKNVVHSNGNQNQVYPDCIFRVQ